MWNAQRTGLRVPSFVGAISMPSNSFPPPDNSTADGLVAVGGELTIRRLILETMEEVLPRLNKIILDGRQGGPVDLSLFEEKP